MNHLNAKQNNTAAFQGIALGIVMSLILWALFLYQVWPFPLLEVEDEADTVTSQERN